MVSGESRDSSNTSAVSLEMLDVVDENDRVVDVKTRGEIHAQGLMHRSVHMLVFNSNGDLYIQKRSMQKDNDPGLWDSSAAGHVDSGEDYLGCAVREIEEELGVKVVPPLESLFRLQASKITGMEHCVVYRCQSDGPFVLQAEEIDEGAWLDVDEMDRRVSEADPSMTQVLRFIWKKFRQKFN